jgi:hypothetical protein
MKALYMCFSALAWAVGLVLLCTLCVVEAAGLA